MSSPHEICEDGTDTIICAVFVIVSIQFLFPENMYLPFDRRLSGLLGTALILIVSEASLCLQLDLLSYIDFDVLVILICIMVINFILLQQEFVSRFLSRLHETIRADSNSGFWLVSFASFIISPFITNDGLCLLLVDPVLDALSPRPDTPEEVARINRLHYCLIIGTASNIGSVMTFTGNPQNIIIAKSLVDLMSGGVFFFLMLLPSSLCWFVSTFYINYCRISALKLVLAQDVGTTNILVYDEFRTTLISVDAPIDHGPNALRAPSIMDISSAAELQADGRTSLLRSTDKNSVATDNLIVSLAGALESARQAPSLVKNGGIVSITAFTLFLGLIVIELSGALPLTLVFAIAAIFMVSSVVLLSYYSVHTPLSGEPPQESGQRKKELRKHISAYVDRLFASIDYNLLIIFFGLNAALLSDLTL
jgi:di/tricarboxylate transporter